jgi:hypothetical protein
MTEPKVQCGTTHYAGCPCHEAAREKRLREYETAYQALRAQLEQAQRELAVARERFGPAGAIISEVAKLRHAVLDLAAALIHRAKCTGPECIVLGEAISRHARLIGELRAGEITELKSREG